MLIFFYLFICGIITQSMAYNRGRNIYLAFLLGLIFGIFAIIGYAIAGDSQKKKDERIAKIINANKN
jgi:hypothetical protein